MASPTKSGAPKPGGARAPSPGGLRMPAPGGKGTDTGNNSDGLKGGGKK
jgi:hypothetical protein